MMHAQTSFFRSVDDLLRNSKQINMNPTIAARMLPAGPRHRKRDLCYAICFMRNLAIFEHSHVLGRPLTDLTEQQIQDEYKKGHKNKVEGKKKYADHLELVRRRYHSLALFLSDVAVQLHKPRLPVPAVLQPLQHNPSTDEPPANTAKSSSPRKRARHGG